MQVWLLAMNLSDGESMRLETALAGGYVLLAATPAWSFSSPDSQSQVPNGTVQGCVLCHADMANLTDLTLFGEQTNDTRSGDNMVWSALYALDADCDGFSNGAELGDPNGTWQIGDANPPVNVYDPNDDQSYDALGTPEQICPLPDGGNGDGVGGDAATGDSVGGDTISTGDTSTGGDTGSTSSGDTASTIPPEKTPELLGPVSCSSTNDFSPMTSGWLLSLGVVLRLLALRRARRRNNEDVDYLESPK